MSDVVRLAVAIPAPTAEPRGAKWAAACFDLLLRALAALRSQRPPAAAVRDAREEARQVRDMAWRIQATDPRFAADLLAAADRHELLYDGR